MQDLYLYHVCLFLSTAIFLIAALSAFFSAGRPYKHRKLLGPLNILLVGTFLSALLLYIPFNAPLFDGDGLLNYFLTVLSSAHNALRLFIVDVDFGELAAGTAALSPAFRTWYRYLAVVEHIFAPFLTLTTLLTMFKQLVGRARYHLHFTRDSYIFSHLNEQSLSLAKSIRHTYPDALIVFNDVAEKEDDESNETMKDAEKIGAICLKDDITVTNFRRLIPIKDKKTYFLIIGPREDENIKHTIRLSKPHKRHNKKDPLSHGYDYPGGDKRIYLFSENTTCEKQLSAIQPQHIKLRRVTTAQTLIFNMLDKNGMEIFESAMPTGKTVRNSATGNEDPELGISALIVGMGMQGSEMVKALSWLCQMHPYRLEINAFDADPLAAEHFHMDCPDLFDCNTGTPPFSKDSDVPLHNGDFTTPGESHYKITVHSGYDADLPSFAHKVKELRDVTYVFVSLGSDDKNLRTAIDLRILFTRMGFPQDKPVIHTVVCNHNTYDMLSKNYEIPLGKRASNGQESYRIRPFGDVEDTYSVASIFHSRLEATALARHKSYCNLPSKKEAPSPETLKSLPLKKRRLAKNAWCQENQAIEEEIRKAEEQFWGVDYNYRSSLASTLHTKFKQQLHIPGSEKCPADRTEPEKWFYRRIEHNRWNAYVRSEGYVYAPTRIRLAKTHHLLIPFDDLPYEEQIKDDD